MKLIKDERVIEENPESHSGSKSSMKNLDDTYNFGDQFLYDKPTEDDQEKSKVREESDSTIPDPNQQTVTSTPPVIAPFTDVSSTKPSSLVTSPPINTEATTITTSLPEITPFIALQLRVARLEQEMSEVKKTDHQADVLASIKSQVPTAVDKYLGTKLDDALLKVLERHTADLIEKYSVCLAQNDDDDDEGPSAGSNRVASAKRRRPESALLAYAESEPSPHKETVGIASEIPLLCPKKRSSDASKKLQGGSLMVTSQSHRASREGTGSARGKTTMETEVEYMVTVPIQQVSSSVPLLILQSSISHLLNQYLLPVKNHSLQLSPLAGGKVWICQILQEINQKRTRERMSDQEAKEIKAEAKRYHEPQPSNINDVDSNCRSSSRQTKPPVWLGGHIVSSIGTKNGHGKDLHIKEKVKVDKGVFGNNDNEEQGRNRDESCSCENSYFQ
ncbi:hypothetical protein Tco_0532226, partial [Tanacetum coccineum]